MQRFPYIFKLKPGTCLDIRSRIGNGLGGKWVKFIKIRRIVETETAKLIASLPDSRDRKTNNGKKIWVLKKAS